MISQAHEPVPQNVFSRVACELVTNAVKSTGKAAAPQLIGVQLRLAGTGLYVEVWDRGDGSPAIPRQSPEAEGGRGLFLVDALSERWDIYRPAAGGKVVWSQLALTETPSARPGVHAPDEKAPFEPVDLALMQRVLSGLRLTSHGGTEAVAV